MKRPVDRIYLLVIGVILVLVILFNKDPDWEITQENVKAYVSTDIKTHKGFVSLEELNERVFKQFGYRIISATTPVPTLRMINEPTCETVFSEWLKISKEPQPEFPPKTIPNGLHDQFVMYNFSALTYKYYNDKNSDEGEKPKNWDKLSELIEWPKDQLAGMAYGTQGVSIYHAMAAYRLDGMSGVVIGSMQPWVEVTALVNGAAKILTVEYNKLDIQEEFQDRMSSILPADFMNQWPQYAGTFDFAASFSSIEHSGMGRYGDPIDPIGDIREMLKIKCMLKKGGLLFLGFPFGTDAIVYNAHRIYGPIRLAMMMYGFDWLGTFKGESEEPFDMTATFLYQKRIFQHDQYTMVLRKL